jgi:hypothetical protein
MRMARHRSLALIDTYVSRNKPAYSRRQLEPYLS